MCVTENPPNYICHLTSFFKFKEIKSFLGEKLLTYMCFYDLSFTDDDCRIFRDFLKELT